MDLFELWENGTVTQHSLNVYELKQAQRKDRYAELAKKNRAKSTQLHDESIKLGSVIPMGQADPSAITANAVTATYSIKLTTKCVSLSRRIKRQTTTKIKLKISAPIFLPMIQTAIEKLKIKLAKLEDRQADMEEKKCRGPSK